MAPTVSSTEITIEDLEAEGIILGDPPDNQVIQSRDAAYLGDDAFNVPKAPGVASVPPPEKASSSSFKTIQTLLQLEGLTGVSFKELENLPDEDAELFRKVMLLAVWPENEAQAKRVIIDVLQILQPRLKKRTQWMAADFADMRKAFYVELYEKGGQLKQLADRLRRHFGDPPPLPKQAIPRPDAPPKTGSLIGKSGKGR